MNIRRHIPNTLTCCNLICGCIATGCAFKADYSSALAFIILGAVFDFFDGFAARLLKVSSPIGKELDSLADDITFGFAPATVVFSLMAASHVSGLPEAIRPYFPYVAFLIAAFSALRLAKFNLDERQTMGFIGLPTPANALFWAALAAGEHERLQSFPSGGWLLLAGVLLSSWLMVAEIPMFALKFKDFSWSNNRLRYAFIALSAICLLLLGWTGFSLLIVLYILCSLLANKTKN